MKRLIITLYATALCLSAAAQDYVESCPQFQPKISLKPDMTVLLYPQGQAAGVGIVENGVAITRGPKEDNGLRGEETNTAGGARGNVGDDARMDFYFPKKNATGQMVIMTPGGGYRRLSTFNEGVYGSQWFTSHGIAVCVLKYRMPNGHDTVPLDDVQNAFRYCRYHAKEWGINQIGVTGGSAGGHLAAIASVLYTDELTRPDFAVLLYPRITLSVEEQCSTRDYLLGTPDKWKDRMDLYREKLAYWSPQSHVTPQAPPTMFILSADDNSVDACDYLPYYEKLIENGVLVEVHVFPTGGHGWGYSSEKIKGKGKDKFARFRPEFEDCLQRWLEDRRAASCVFPDVFIDAESFSSRGGWVTDQQAMDVLGSPYLLAHGAGEKVADASTEVSLPSRGRYYAYVRTYNWTSPWAGGKGPGAFCLKVDGKALDQVCGTEGNAWTWQYAGSFKTSGKKVNVSLSDLSGFDGRCDAVCFLKREIDPASLPSDPASMHAMRLRFNPDYDTPSAESDFDLVVVGGGISGICAAVTAARLGMSVAIVNDRPVLGGNNSAEVRVHLGGRIELNPYPNLGNLIKEFGQKKCNNADSGEKYDDRNMKKILLDAGVRIFAPYHAVSVTKAGDVISSVSIRHINSAELLRLKAPLFADCTGDGSLGVMAGADYTEGREARSEYGETMAPEIPDNLHLGASLLWNSRLCDTTSAFPEFSYGLEFNENTVQRVTKSEWYWETGLNDDMISEVEKIRDFGLLAVYSNWSYLKNRSSCARDYAHRKLDWVSFVTGKRESRRLLGDHILTENDIIGAVPYPDGTCSTSWGIDLHYFRKQNSKDFPGKEFLTTAVHKYFEPYPIPYRCLYSRNVSNLFLAGRDISCTHVAMGSIRVMRTCGMMGEVVGMAASVCKAHSSLPRSVYTDYLDELKQLMEEGAGEKGLPNDQDFCIHGCYPPVQK